MLHETVLIPGGYLAACAVAWVLHESAHYAVHRLYANSVSFGVNRRGPYVDAVYDPDAPTLLYTPLVALGIAGYIPRYPIPQLDLVGWSLVAVPLVILIAPTGADIRACLEAAQ